MALRPSELWHQANHHSDPDQGNQKIQVAANNKIHRATLKHIDTAMDTPPQITRSKLTVLVGNPRTTRMDYIKKGYDIPDEVFDDIIGQIMNLSIRKPEENNVQ